MTEMISSTETGLSCARCWLKDISVFQNCPDDLLNELYTHKSIDTYKKGEQLIAEHEEFKGLFCIQRGVVKVTRSGKRNKEFILWLARPGDIIGLDSFINNEDYSFSARAVEDVSACFIPASDFRSLIGKNPALSVTLMKNLCETINFIEDRITSMARKKIREQFAEMLISLAQQDQKPSGDEIAVDYSVKDLANIVGTTRNYLYKILSDFSDQKLISMKNRKVFIKDFDKLSHIAVGGVTTM